MLLGILIIALAVFVVLLGPLFITRVTLPIRLLVGGYLVFGIASEVLFKPTVLDLTSPDFGPDTYFATLDPWFVIGVFFVLAGCVFVGAAVIRCVVPGAVHDLAGIRRPPPVHLRLPPGVLWFSVICLVLAVIGVGPVTVLTSPAYLYATGPSTLLKLSIALLPLAIIVAAVVYFGSDTQGLRMFAVTVLVLIEIFELSQATRGFALFFVLVFVGGWLTGRWDTRQTVVRAILAAVLALALIGIPLGLRNLPEHGLIASVHYLFTQPGTFFTGASDPVYNILVGVPLSLYVWRQEPPISAHALWTSLNPAPGGLTDWNTLAPTLRLNIYEPYPAIGELLNHGWLALCLYAMTLGAIVEALSLVARRCSGQWASGIQLLITGTTALILVRSTQYNLRAESRLVYYLIFGVGALTVLSRLVSGHRDTSFPPSALDGRTGTAPQVSRQALVR